MAHQLGWYEDGENYVILFDLSPVYWFTMSPNVPDWISTGTVSILDVHENDEGDETEEEIDINIVHPSSYKDFSLVLSGRDKLEFDQYFPHLPKNYVGLPSGEELICLRKY